jgi:tetraacyldisaccharide 4'-kinase
MTSSASLILIPLSTIYGAVTRARLEAYRRGWLSVAKLTAPVISVGNLTTGGTGKTPMVEWVCRVLADKWLPDGGDVEPQKKICVLTRGYGRANPNSQVVVSNGTDLLAGEREAGDEPFLLASNLRGIAAVVANPNRAAAGEWAMEHLGSEVFVLDDGFQHLGLARDFDIVTIDATNPFASGSLLPGGRLREPVGGLSRADCVVITRTEQVEDWTRVDAAIKRVDAAVPIFSSRMVTSGIRELSNKRVANENLRTEALGAFCGVGNPESFFNHLRREGFELAFMRTFADHHLYSQADLDRIVKQAKASGAAGLITTAKDATKISSLSLDIPCYVLEIEISIDDDDRLIQLIREARLK